MGSVSGIDIVTLWLMLIYYDTKLDGYWNNLSSTKMIHGIGNFKREYF